MGSTALSQQEGPGFQLEELSGWSLHVIQVRQIIYPKPGKSYQTIPVRDYFVHFCYYFRLKIDHIFFLKTYRFLVEWIHYESSSISSSMIVLWNQVLALQLVVLGVASLGFVIVLST